MSSDCCLYQSLIVIIGFHKYFTVVEKGSNQGQDYYKTQYCKFFIIYTVSRIFWFKISLSHLRIFLNAIDSVINFETYSTWDHSLIAGWQVN